MNVERIFTKLYINGKVIGKNFEFKIVKQINSLTEIAEIKIKKEYFEANDFSLKEKDKISIAMQINKETKVFDGIIIDFFNTKSAYDILTESKNSFELSSVASEKSFVNTKASSIISQLTNFEIDSSLDVQLERFIITKSAKREVLKTLLNTIEEVLKTDFYYYFDDKLKIKKELKGETYKIDDYTIKMNSSHITIFPLPGLSLADKLSYKGKEYSLKTIIMQNKNFLLEVFK